MPAWHWSLHEAGDWMIRTRPSGTSLAVWYGEAKRRADGPFADHALYEPVGIEIYFEFADTEADVVAKLRRELTH